MNGEGSNEVLEATLTVATVARRLGVAPTTLRTWDRRYGLGPSVRAAGSHRRYTRNDIARLERMRRLVLTGVTPAEAARIALSWGAGDAAADAAVSPVRYAGTGGRVLRLTHATPRARGLGRAAMSLDAHAVTRVLDSSLASDGVVAMWETLLRPLLVTLGDRWAHSGEGVEVEHVVTECANRVLHRRPMPANPTNARPVLLACVPGEMHALPLVVLQATLAAEQVAATVLGASTPATAIEAAVRRTGPAVILLWAQHKDVADVTVFDAVPRLRPATTVIAGGAGWPAALPREVRFVTGLEHAGGLVRDLVRG